MQYSSLTSPFLSIWSHLGRFANATAHAAEMLATSTADASKVYLSTVVVVPPTQGVARRSRAFHTAI